MRREPLATRALRTALAVLLVSACAPRSFSYTVLQPVEEPANHAEFGAAIRDWIKAKFSRFHVAEIEAPSMASMDQGVRHCRRDRRGMETCHNLGHHSAVVIDSIKFTGPDTADARVVYVVNELTKPEVEMTVTSVHGVRSRDGTWTLRQGRYVMTGQSG